MQPLLHVSVIIYIYIYIYIYIKKKTLICSPENLGNIADIWQLILEEEKSKWFIPSNSRAC